MGDPGRKYTDCFELLGLAMTFFFFKLARPVVDEMHPDLQLRISAKHLCLDAHRGCCAVLALAVHQLGGVAGS